jgi:hypothetical protein
VRERFKWQAVLQHVRLALGLDHDFRQKYAMRSMNRIGNFRSGVQHEGYWNSSHAKLQLEDAVDAISTIFPQVDYAFLFDQSSGHTKM